MFDKIHDGIFPIKLKISLSWYFFGQRFSGSSLAFTATEHLLSFTSFIILFKDIVKGRAGRF